ncbi:cutinase [Rhodocollybia butyracea]|uniref:Cutinase n=1 Tax=Rhodocollybia butyracea TaxID=206335 RepID=A0A9P5Q3F5_9AGAR|nr:cutinase [Rhodocollybia butyracea]
MTGFKPLFITLALALTGFSAPSLDSRQACADVIVVFARGTLEPAPIGTIVGPPLEGNLTTALAADGKTLSFQGVDYPASIAGFLEGGDPTGSATMATMLTTAATSCPSAAIVSSGYSQGAQLVHNSAKLVSSDVSARINAIVMFGDPDDGQAVAGVSQSIVDVFCNAGDDICEGGDMILPAHLTYGTDAPAAASFITARV